MPHEVELIATIAIGFALAFAFGFIAIRLGLPPLVGYLIAGVCIGPSTPGFVADREMAGQLAEIGVMLLMFGVACTSPLADLMAVRRIAIPAQSLRSSSRRARARMAKPGDGAWPGLGWSEPFGREYGGLA